MKKSGENEQNLSEKIRENEGFFILNIGGSSVPVLFQNLEECGG